MFGNFLKQMTDAVEAAGGAQKLAEQGMGMAQSFMKPEAESALGRAQKDVARDDAPEADPWGSVSINGNKKSVLVGINYRGQRGELRGCINDVIMMKQYLSDEQGFPNDSDHMLILTEDEPEERHPTKAHILNGMSWLVDGAKAGDSLFFHYSGHGTRVPDVDGDEEDGYDEALCPLDFKSANMIIDDVVNQKLVSTLPQGCRLTIVMDCCHSGTACDLPYMFKGTKENLVNWQAELPQMLMSHSWDFKNFQTLLATGTDFGKKLFAKYQESSKSGEEDQEAKFYRETSKAAMAEVVMFSGCKDDQTSADVADTSSFELPTDCGPGGAGGACTNAFVSVMHSHPKITYIELLDKMRIILSQKKFTQVPCLTSSRMIPLDAQFCFSD